MGNACSQHSTQIGYRRQFQKMPKSLSVKNIPNLCRKLAHRYMQAFYTDWVYKVFWHFFEDVPNLCRMLAHRYMQAFYTDWVHKIDPHTFSTQIGYILKNVPNLCRMLAHNK